MNEIIAAFRLFSIIAGETGPFVSAMLDRIDKDIAARRTEDVPMVIAAATRAILFNVEEGRQDLHALGEQIIRDAEALA